jgi:hypothetical protein
VKAIEDQSLYEILEVRTDAAPEEIAQAYERARAIYAPNSLAVYTLVAPEEAAAFTRRIEEARSVLLDPEARARYDAGLAPGQPPPDVRPPPPPTLPPVIPPAKAEPPPTPAEAPPPPAATPAEAAPPQPTPLPAAPAAPASPAAAAIPAAAAGPVAAPPVAAPAEAEREPPLAAPPARPAQAPSGFSVPEGVPWTGEVLRRVRESRGLTLHQIAERTKVARYHLENIEADRYATLPAAVYLRGILVSLAKELRLDGPKVARSYLEQASAASREPSPPKPR